MSVSNYLHHPKIIKALSLTASLVVAFQIAYSLLKGGPACLNEGCRVVESLTVVPPLVLNIAGLVFFQLVFWSFRFLEAHPTHRDGWIGLLLLSGLAVEAVLLAYQLFVARAMCSYCLLILAFVIALNVAAGIRQLVSGLATLAAVVAAFSLLAFMPARVLPQNYSFELGTFGVRSCEAPSKKIYLFFSSDCPHCHRVIRELENCNSCELYLNPVENVNSLELEGVVRRPSYSPEINRLMLAVFGISEVPVLVVKNREGYTFIKGENNILSYVRLACFQQEPVFYLDRQNETRTSDITLFSDKEENCSIDISCSEKGGAGQSTEQP
jgi:uncharacterized membrane protein